MHTCDYHRHHKPGEREPTCQGTVLRIRLQSEKAVGKDWYACETIRRALQEEGHGFDLWPATSQELEQERRQHESETDSRI